MQLGDINPQSIPGRGDHTPDDPPRGCEHARGDRCSNCGWHPPKPEPEPDPICPGHHVWGSPAGSKLSYCDGRCQIGNPETIPEDYVP